jgi:hypothetical protein
MLQHIFFCSSSELWTARFVYFYQKARHLPLDLSFLLIEEELKTLIHGGQTILLVELSTLPCFSPWPRKYTMSILPSP